MIKLGVLEQVESFRPTKAEAKRKRDTLILVIMTVFVHERKSYGHFKWSVAWVDRRRSVACSKL